MSNNVEEKILHGTTTVGIKATDGVVLCADMRASAGYFIANNNTMKIQKIDEHAGLTLAGGYGVMRKTPGVAEIALSAKIYMGIMGIGGVIAIIGGLMFVYICATRIHTIFRLIVR